MEIEIKFIKKAPIDHCWWVNCHEQAIADDMLITFEGQTYRTHICPNHIKYLSKLRELIPKFILDKELKTEIL